MIPGTTYIRSWYVYQHFLFDFPFDEIYRSLLFFTLNVYPVSLAARYRGCVPISPVDTTWQDGGDAGQDAAAATALLGDYHAQVTGSDFREGRHRLGAQGGLYEAYFRLSQ